MKIVLSQTMGYCKGVSRALGMAENAISQAALKGKPVYSMGKLIHNRQVCACFAQQGMEEIEGPEGHAQGVVVLRAHGIPDATRTAFLESGFEIVDATCPVVKRNLHLIAEYSKTHRIVIVGHAHHPETAAMQGVMVAGQPIFSKLITDIEHIGVAQQDGRYAVFVQTTFDQQQWIEIKQALTHWCTRGCELVFVNEICPSSINRREAVLSLARACDGVVVIGGKESANTNALYELVVQQGKKAWHIEDETQITEDMYACAILGITAGASTPPSLIQRIVEKLEEE
ncbi:MAG: 4-hydroxy-3-methylbut-2-enyl diphosphate reductase [Sphaerochaeta sp.]|jgi:4-hydroxy-3-methylbut-2-enyl diphosphate reductase|uniref:4-hydroxy-3-methylbut-2-enyl diphosphate reductase n=1 Tax=Sphaerochaeta sp. TaxID=1972642 RepID=UPI002FCC3414